LTEAPLALKAVKQAANMATQAPSLEAGLDIERALYEPLLKTQDRDEGLLAFREKRAPVYVGR
jgi:methylglutaconyl-CoA hydratase